ncbi:MAG: AraC family transcriptional regulator [Clostridiales bacterium]|nr:AraC family transcriptional regulator [Clostridiales bacterium]
MHTEDTNALRIYYCGREQCSPGHFWGPAVRPHYLLHVVLKGKGHFQYKKKDWPLKAGDAFLIEPMETHFYEADQENPWEYAWVGFDGSAVHELLAQTALRDAPVFLSTSLDCCQPMASLANAFLMPERSQLGLLSLLFSLFSKMPAPVTRGNLSFEEQYYQTAVEYIRNNYTYDLKVQDIADYVGIDRTYLYKIFMREARVSPKQYLLQFRIRAAGKLLQSQKYTVTETAYSCGFRDAAAFCTCFRQQVGMTPRQYKERMRLGAY